MAKKTPEETVPAFEVKAVQYVEVNFPSYQWDSGYRTRIRVENIKRLSRTEAKELADAVALAANEINA